MLGDGRVLIADSGNHRVLVVDASGSRIDVFAGTGTPGSYVDPGGDPKRTRLEEPAGLAAFPDGSVLIADTQNHRVLIVSADDSRIRRFVGTDVRGLKLDCERPDRTRLAFPWGVAVSPDGSRTAIADSWNHRVLMIDNKTSRITRAVGTGKHGSYLDFLYPRHTQLSDPQGVAFLPDGRVLIADTWNHRILILSSKLLTIDQVLNADGHRSCVNSQPEQQFDPPTALRSLDYGLSQFRFPRSLAALPNSEAIVFTDLSDFWFLQR